ncbi:MAG: translation initiation factor IF-2, partial [Bryobacteraceae bacterium]|nr:translation initiation factor IF-2 [Bryobacteraceae bacterium]
SGPRQPLPGGELPRPAVVSPGRPRPEAPRQAAPGAPRIPQPPSHPHQHQPQGPRPPLAGQPVSRPVVPPRPDLVARLQAQSQPKASPGQPPAARPGVPMPGQPIYQGPPRRGPGQPPLGGPRPMRGRGPHPTSPALVPPPPTEVARRDTGRKRSTGRRREEIEGNQRTGPSRREVETPRAANIEITISEGITVKEFSEKLGIKAALVIKQLVDRKIFATINQTLDIKLAQDLARIFGAQATQMSYEEESIQESQQTEVAGDRYPRPPVVTVMGHVDHGKTSLLDAIRKTNVAAREAGGITQHIGAYHVDIGGRKIVFIDTPGHEAFTRMRARGAKVTDIVILVVAADDGVMPQTREAIDHAKAAKVPIIVAVNKIDKPEAQPDRVKQQLTELGLMPEDWGGDTPFVPVSAKQIENIDLLLEMVLLVADMQDLKGNPVRPAVASVLEAKLDRGRGPVATVLVRDGTLRTGDYVLCGSVFSRIRALMNDRGERVDEVGPSMPVEILGLDSLPDVGDDLNAVTDLAKARQIAEFRETKTREIAMAKTRVSLEQFHAQLREGESKELNLILKADVGGTAEVLSDTLQKLSTDKVSIRVISTGVGAISESDVNLASASDAIIVGFNVRPERKAAELAETEKVDVRLHTVIYELTDEVKKAMVGMLEPVFKEVFKGRADVRDTFRITKVGTVAGCYVTDGTITRDCEVRLLRDNVVIHTGRIDALKRFKNDASEVKQNFECGISLVNYHDIKPGDILECFVKERVAQDSLT